MRISADVLERHGACSSQVEVFRREWPDGCEVTQNAAKRVVKLALDIDWAAGHLLPAPAWKAYQEATAPALKAYEEAKATALKAYQEAKAGAFVAAAQMAALQSASRPETAD
jgi:hypothetical protein